MISFFTCPAAEAEQGKSDLIEAFLKDLINVNITGERIIEKYMCVDTPGEELSLRIYRLRMMLLGQSKKITDNFSENIKSYKNLPENEQNLLITPKDEENVFRFKGEQNIAFLILITNGKIASFTTKKQGDKRIFITSCNRPQ